jgi:pheromone shutdown protein TraB
MGWEQLKQWILYNGTLSALGALIAGGHILSIVTAFAAAPVTSLNPLLAAGWFAGLTEARLIKPTVSDFNALSDDLSSFKGLRKNK